MSGIEKLFQDIERQIANRASNVLENLEKAEDPRPAMKQETEEFSKESWPWRVFEAVFYSETAGTPLITNCFAKSAGEAIKPKK